MDLTRLSTTVLAAACLGALSGVNTPGPACSAIGKTALVSPWMDEIGEINVPTSDPELHWSNLWAICLAGPANMLRSTDLLLEFPDSPLPLGDGARADDPGFTLHGEAATGTLPCAATSPMKLSMA